jgi:hypothetical protein
MRISADQQDPGYVNRQKHGKCCITLNDKIITHVLTADEEEGFVIVLSVGESDYIRTRIEGDVKITFGNYP